MLVTQHMQGRRPISSRRAFHFADNFFTWMRNNSMLDDEAFVKAWEANVETDADRAIIWRRFVLACAAYHCVQLDGDFVECGAYTGVGVKTVVDYLGGTEFPKDFWVYDLFEHEEWMLHHAMPEHGPGPGGEGAGTKFTAYPQVKIFKGDDSRGVRQASRRGRSPTCTSTSTRRRPRSRRWMRCSTGSFRAASSSSTTTSGRAFIAARSWPRTRGSRRGNIRVFPLPTGQGIVIKR